MASEYFYPGGEYPMDSDENDAYIGHRIPAAKLGVPTGIQSANQLKEVSQLLNQGVKNIEVSGVKPEVFDHMPKKHLKEINRLSKLTGSEPTFHGPVVDPSGFTQQGWSESNREAVENQFEDVVERGHELNPEGNFPITIHASATPGTEHFQIKDPETGKLKEVSKKMVAVDKESGKMIPLERRKIYSPGRGEVTYTPEKRLQMKNNTDWDSQISNLNFYKKEADEMVMEGLGVLGGENYEKLIKGELKRNELTPEQQEGYRRLKKAEMMLEDVEAKFVNYYDRMRKYGKFKELPKKVKKGAVKKLNEINGQWKKWGEERNKLLKERKKNGMDPSVNIINPAGKRVFLDNVISELHDVKEKTGAPQTYAPIEQFTKEKASETLSNVALKSFEKYGKKSPIISVENPPYGGALSKGKDMKELVQKTRKKFVNKLSKQRGMSKRKAEKEAERLIGVTWDTSHINMLRKRGYGKEQITKETKEVAPYIKHVHLNDNFGHTHTDLPPGTGNVPMKDVLDEIEKKSPGAKKIFEGGGFVSHFKHSPYPMLLEGTGTPVREGMQQPYWNQMASTYGQYSSGMGRVLPQQHFTTYGGGFSGLPPELGGQTQARTGKASRMSGTPMQ